MQARIQLTADAQTGMGRAAGMGVVVAQVAWAYYPHHLSWLVDIGTIRYLLSRYPLLPQRSRVSRG
jgi:hypothetical protein